MKFAVIGEHRDCLRKQGWIEFEELLTPHQLSIIEQTTAAVLASRLKEPAGGIFDLPAEKLFSVSRDLWRDAQPLKKIILGRNLAEVASELIEHKPLRFGYDLLIPQPSTHRGFEQGSLKTMFNQTPTLDEISCIQGVRCGLILCIKADQSNNDNHSFFPSIAGNGVFFRPGVPIPFPELSLHKGSLYVMIVYTDAKAVYRQNTSDPHANDLKRLGYNFGDKLSDTLNPLVFS